MLGFMPGPMEWLIVLGVILLLFGAPRLPRLARSLGESFKELKRGISDDPADEESPKPGEQRSETTT